MKTIMNMIRAIFAGSAAFLLIGLAAAVVTIGLFVVKPGFVSTLDLRVKDTMFKIRSTAAAPPEVVIVAVDEKSINMVGRWPWKRSNIAAMIDGLNEASVVAFDMVFSEHENPLNDSLLGRSVKDGGNVVLGYFFRDDATQKPSALAHERLETAKVNVVRYIDGTDKGAGSTLREFAGLEFNIDDITGGPAGHGSFNIIPEEDGVLRTANLLYKYNGEIYPALSLEALRVYAADNVVMNAASYGVDSIFMAGTYIPVDERGRFMLNYYGPGATFKTYSAVDVINKTLPPGTFKDKIVFVGATEIGIYDIRVTPIDPVYPGVEVHATIAGNVLEGRFLTQDAITAFIGLLSILISPFILAFIISKVHRTYLSLAIFFSFIIFYYFFAYFLFSRYGMVVTVIYPVFSFSFGYLLMEAYRNMVVERKSKFYKKAFSTYVPPQLVSEIIKNPDKLKLGGEKREITILFSDIRGFTTLSESLDPVTLVALLNEYLTPMTEIVFKEKGMLDKYIGDAIMAVFNAPLDIEGHQKHACTAALTMAQSMPALNVEWSKKNYPPISIGIGVNTGEAVVGNMGADLRFDYTAIGDSVNLTSRLEGMTKVYKVCVIVSEFTYKVCKDDFIFRILDLVKVKGKHEPVGIYELMGFNTEVSKYAELASKFREAYVDFRKGKFKTAKKAFEELLAKYPGDGPSQVYIERCDEFIATPPPADWDGVYVAKTK